MVIECLVFYVDLMSSLLGYVEQMSSLLGHDDRMSSLFCFRVSHLDCTANFLSMVILSRERIEIICGVISAEVA